MQAAGVGMRRCRYLRSLLLRDQEAWTKFHSTAKQMLALSFVFFSRELDFASELDFENVSVDAALPRERASDRAAEAEL